MQSDEKKRIAQVHMIGPKVVERLAAAGFTRLEDFAGLDAVHLYGRIRAACDPIWMEKPHSMAVAALQNLIDAANALGDDATDESLFPNPFTQGNIRHD